MATKTEIVLQDGQFVKRIVTEMNLGLQEHVLNKLTESQNMMVPNITMLGNLPIHMLVGKEHMVLLTPLQKLPFNTWFRPSMTNRGHLEVCYVDCAGAVLINDPWPVPAGWGKALFALSFTRMGSVYGMANCYLWIYRGGELFSPYYPNTYDDGRICMGREWDSQKNLASTNPVNDLIRSHTSFHETRLNADLIRDSTAQTFVRTPDAWAAPLLQPGDLLRRTSLSIMTGFALS